MQQDIVSIRARSIERAMPTPGRRHGGKARVSIRARSIERAMRRYGQRRRVA